MEWIWLLIIIAFAFFLMFFGGGLFTGGFLEVVSFLFLAALIALILASRDPLIIGIAVLFIGSKILKRRPVRHEYDIDSAAYGQNIK